MEVKHLLRGVLEVALQCQVGYLVQIEGLYSPATFSRQGKSYYYQCFPIEVLP